MKMFGNRRNITLRKIAELAILNMISQAGVRQAKFGELAERSNDLATAPIGEKQDKEKKRITGNGVPIGEAFHGLPFG